MKNTYTPSTETTIDRYFKEETWNAFYRAIVDLFQKVGIQQKLPATLHWKSGRLNPESFAYYNVKEVSQEEVRKFFVRATYFVDGNLQYYSAEVMSLHVWVWEGDIMYRVEFDYDIHANKLTVNYDVPQGKEQECLSVLKSLET